jgi:hypothetical protein
MVDGMLIHGLQIVDDLQLQQEVKTVYRKDKGSVLRSRCSVTETIKYSFNPLKATLL